MRTLIDIDDSLLKYAMEELGTKTKRDTVNEALRRAAAPQLARARLDWWETYGPSVDDVEQDRVEGWR